MTEALLDNMSHRSFQFFWDSSNPDTGITRDKSTLAGQPVRRTAARRRRKHRRHGFRRNLALHRR